jgi:hypothetical protein
MTMYGLSEEEARRDADANTTLIFFGLIHVAEALEGIAANLDHVAEANYTHEEEAKT